MSCCNTCGTWPCCCVDTGLPSNVVYRGECTDPGTLTTARYLLGIDYKFCPGRLAANGGGILQSRINGSGNPTIYWTNDVVLDPDSTQAAEDTSFGNLLILSPDDHVRQLIPPNSSGLFLQTNGSGELIFGDPPAATVPDPLVVTDLVVAGGATIEDLEVNGTVELNNISSGTAVSVLGLNASNELITQSIAQGLTVSMFFESPTSPNADDPNKDKNSGEYLVIGNRLFDSGGDNITVTTSESLTVQDAGTYLIMWQAQIRMGGGTSRKAGVWLEINGTFVNQGTGRTDGNVSGVDANNGAMMPATGMDVRTYAANDVIKLGLNSADNNIETFEVRLVAVRFPTA